MGCSISPSKRIVNITSVSSPLFTYPRSITLAISSGKSEKVSQTFQVTEPAVSLSDSYKIADLNLFLSLCVMPGLDPHSDFTKVCQDACYVKTDDTSLLMCLFDGHGKYGELVVRFCCGQVEEHFAVIKDKYAANPTMFLKEIADKCEERLQSSFIDISSSGCTALFSYLTKGNLYMASIGDSRAILATEVLPPMVPVKEVDSHHTEVLNTLKDQRKLPSTLYSVQLTKDQKPENPEELSRIIEKGGRVQQLLDENGLKIGPYRVFDMKGNYPGLAMSRSFGDMLGKQVGIISTPIFTKHKLQKASDSFIVLASDGVWDVMDNQEVVNFIETFRTKCLKNLDSFEKNYDLVNAEVVTIAQLLCEEARCRWCAIVESENVMIDDISCVILEFNQKQSAHCNEIKYLQPRVPKVEMVADVRRATSLREVSTRDPRRGSFCLPK